MDRLTLLERENAALRERLDQIERTMLGPDEPYAFFALPRREERVLAALMTRALLTQEQMHAIVYFDVQYADMPELTVVQSHVSKLRKKLGRYGVVVSSRRHTGYWMSQEEKVKVRRLLNAIATSAHTRAAA